MLHKILSNKEYLKICYKLLHDILFISLAFFLLALVAEGTLPGIITGHIEFSQIIIFIFLIIFAIYALGNFLEISFTGGKINKKTASLLLFILALLIFNSLLKINIILNLFILLLVAITGYYIYKVLLEET